MNKYTIYLKHATFPIDIEGSKYEMDYLKNKLYIYNDSDWKIGIFDLAEVAGFVVKEFGGKKDEET